MKSSILLAGVMLAALLLPAMGGAVQGPLVVKPGSRSPLAGGAVDRGLAPPDLRLRIDVGLDLRDKPALDAFLAQASDPASPLFQHWLTQDEFNALYGPTQLQEQRVIDWLRGAGWQVVETFPNHLLVVAEGSPAAVEAAFHVSVHTVTLHGVSHYAILDEPRFPADIAAFTTGVVGLDDLARMQPRAGVGGGCCAFAPADLKTFYDNTAAQTGSGQTIVIAGAYAWLDQDVQGFDQQWGLAALPAGSGQVCTGPIGQGAACLFDAQNSIEISLDVEYAHGTAPAAKIKNYMAGTTLLADFQTMYNKVVADNPGHTVSTSWGSCESGAGNAYQQQNDNIFANGNAKGQSWFAASGDGGSDDCGDGTQSVDHPANSPHVIGVGGTAATCSSGMTAGDTACHGYGSETAWSGSGGGKSALFGKPAFQAGCGVPADGKRDVPDVGLEADPAHYGNYVEFTQLWWTVGGTSDAAPQWGGLFAELNQKKGGTGLGLPGARLYALCGTSSFHDVTSGSNGAFSAGAGYDLVTGAGTPEMKNLLASY